MFFLAFALEPFSTTVQFLEIYLIHLQQILTCRLSYCFWKKKQNAGHDLKDSALAFNGAAAAAAAAAGWPYPSMYYPYDPTLAAYPFGG